MRAKLCNALTLVALLLLLAAFAMLSVEALMHTSAVELSFSADNNEHVVFLQDNIPINLLMLAAGTGLAVLLASCKVGRGAIRALTAGMLGWVVALGVWWVLAAKAEPGADARSILDAADAIVQSSYQTLAGSTYFRTYPFQTGFLLYAIAFTRLFGSARELAMQLANVAYVAAAYLALAQITRRLFADERVELVCVALLGLCVQPVFLCTFIYGLLPGLALALWGAYCIILYLQRRRGGFAVLGALLIVAAVIVKKNFTIVAIAGGIVLLLDALRNRRLGSLLVCIVLAALTIVGPNGAQRYAERRAGTQFGPGMPQSAWLVMGVSESSMCSGWYNAELSRAFAESGFDAEGTNEANLAAVQARMELLCSRPRYLAAFAYHKLVSQWNEPAFQSIWSSAAGTHTGEPSSLAQSVYAGRGARVINAHFNFYVQLVYAALAIALASLCRDRRRTDAMLLLPLVILGAICYHAVFEAKAQYALVYLPMMLPSAAYGLCRLAKGLCLRRAARAADRKGRRPCGA